jgi:uncharacterized protein
LLVEAIFTALQPEAPPRWQLASLLHDAPEYVIGDLISPFKAAIGLDYKAFELRLLSAIHRRYGLPSELPVEITLQIKTADGIAAYFEATKLAGFSVDEAARFFGTPPALPSLVSTTLHELCAAPAAGVQAAFLDRFRGLADAAGLQ